jgi:GAF domain-containing protein
VHIEREALDQALSRLPADAPLVPDLQTALKSVMDVVQPLLGAAGSALLLVYDALLLRDAAASDDGGRLLEVAQLEAEEGPCVESLVYDVHVATTDVQVDARWPALADRLAGSPVRAVLGVPVHVNGAAVGSLNVYAPQPYEWDDSDLAALRAVAAVVQHLLAAAVLAGQQERLVTQLRQALDSRLPIERAVGLLMERHQEDAVAAFNRLRRTARSQRRRVAEVAPEILAEHERARSPVLAARPKHQPKRAH